MKTLLSITASAALMLGAADAVAAQLPTFEVMGFPITNLQVAVVGSAHVSERPPAPELTLGGMPASPHQVSVLTPPPTVVQHEVAPSFLKAGVHDVPATASIQ